MSWAPEVATRALMLRALVLMATVGMLTTVLPVDGPGPVTAFAAVVALALSTGLLLPSPRCSVQASRSSRSPDAPRPDERCHRGVFRRQTSPDAPGRPRPRAPQLV